MKKRNIKFGISLVSLAIIIIVMIILAGVVVTTSFKSIDTANIKMFAMEIADIKTNVDNYYLKHNSYPIGDTIEYTVPEGTTDFADENINEGVVSLKEINISQIGLKNLNYGNKKETNDVYAMSQITGKVYYLLGVKYNSKINYTLNEDVEKIAGVGYLNKPEYNEITEYDVIFKVNNTKPTNLPVTVIVKIPKSATINSITATNSKVVSQETVELDYKKYTVNETGENRNGNYVIEVNYTYNGSTKTAKYTVTNFNNTNPQITYTTTTSNGLTTVNVNVTGNNITDLKYETNIIENSSYFENYGKKINNNSFIVKDDDVFTIYAKDSSGNSGIKNIIKVSFNANEGTVTTASKYVEVNSTYGLLPTPTKEGYTFVGWSFDSIPAEYQQVEYIESNGNQYIDTGITLSNTTRWEMKTDLAGGFGISVGSGQELANTGYMIFSFVGNGNSLAVYIDGNNRSTYNLSDGPHTFFYDRVNLIYGYDDIETSFVKKDTVSSEPLVLLAWREHNTNYYLCKGEFYWLRWFENNDLKHYFIPCYRKSDNEAGLYDTVNGVFYTNQGSGTFSVGNSVPYVTELSTVTDNSNHTLTAIWSENE